MVNYAAGFTMPGLMTCHLSGLRKARKGIADAGAYSPTASGSVANGALPTPGSAQPEGAAGPVANGREPNLKIASSSGSGCAHSTSQLPVIDGYANRQSPECWQSQCKCQSCGHVARESSHLHRM